MATNTTNLNLVKPDLSDFYDIAVFNSNSDILDTAVSAKTNKAVSSTIQLTVASWVQLATPIGEYNYKYEYVLSGITANDILNGSVTLATEEIAQDCGLSQRSETSTNKVTFYAKDIPSGAITIDYNYIQGV